MDFITRELPPVLKQVLLFEDTNTKEIVELKRQSVIQAMKKIILLSSLARREGLLGLEVYAQDSLQKDGLELELATAIILVCDGTDPAVLSNILEFRYISGQYKEHDALIYLIYTVGILNIQQGMNPRIIAEFLLAMIPRPYLDYFSKDEESYYTWYEIVSDEELDVFLGRTPEKLESIRNNFCNRNDVLINDLNNIGLINLVLPNFDDRSIQRVLREVDNIELAVALLGMNSAARTKIITNLSKRLADMTIEQCESIKSCSETDIEKACTAILKVIVVLSDCGEITYGNTYLKSVLEVLNN